MAFGKGQEMQGRAQKSGPGRKGEGGRRWKERKKWAESGRESESKRERRDSEKGIFIRVDRLLYSQLPVPLQSRTSCNHTEAGRSEAGLLRTALRDPLLERVL